MDGFEPGVEFLQDATGSDGVTLVGEGVEDYHALYAAVLEGAVDRVELRDLGPSFRERVTSVDGSYDPRLTTYAVVEGCDVSHCLSALADSTVQVDGIDEQRVV